MNILPFGVARMRGFESLHSSARLWTFLQRIRDEVEAEARASQASGSMRLVDMKKTEVRLCVFLWTLKGWLWWQSVGVSWSSGGLALGCRRPAAGAANAAAAPASSIVLLAVLV